MNDKETFKEFNLNCLLVCTSCYSIPKISILFEHPVRIYIQCNCIREENEIILIPDYIKKLQLLRLKNNNIKGSRRIHFFYCKDCNRWLYNIGNNEHVQHQVSSIMINEPHSCGKHDLYEYKYYCIDCKRHLCLSCYQQHDKKHNLKNLAVLKAEISNNQMYKRIEEIEDIFNSRNNDFIEAAMSTNDESIIKRIKQTIEDNNNLLKIAKIIYYSYCFFEPFNNFKSISIALQYSKMILDTYPSLPNFLTKYRITEEHSLHFFWTFQTILQVQSNRNTIKTIKEDEIILPNIVLLSNERIFFATQAKRLKVYNLITNNYELNSDEKDFSIYNGIFSKWEDNKILYKDNEQFEVFEITNKSKIISCFIFKFHVHNVIPLSNNIIALSDDKGKMEVWDTTTNKKLKTCITKETSKKLSEPNLSKEEKKKVRKANHLQPLLKTEESPMFICVGFDFNYIDSFYFWSSENFEEIKSLNISCYEAYELKNHKILCFRDFYHFSFIIDSKTLCIETMFIDNRPRKNRLLCVNPNIISNYFYFCEQYCLAKGEEDFSFVYFEKNIYKKFSAPRNDPLIKDKRVLAIGYHKLLSYENNLITIWNI